MKAELNDVSLGTIRAALKRATLPRVDLVVGIATGGTVPAALVAYEIDAPLSLMRVNFRGPSNKPEHPTPVVLSPPLIPAGTRSILLVDDVSVSGLTLQAAKSHLGDFVVTTLVVKGKAGAADIVLMTDRPGCVRWPWGIYEGHERRV